MIGLNGQVKVGTLLWVNLKSIVGGYFVSLASIAFFIFIQWIFSGSVDTRHASLGRYFVCCICHFFTPLFYKLPLPLINPDWHHCIYLYTFIAALILLFIPHFKSWFMLVSQCCFQKSGWYCFITGSSLDSTCQFWLSCNRYTIRLCLSHVSFKSEASTHKKTHSSAGCWMLNLWLCFGTQPIPQHYY